MTSGLNHFVLEGVRACAHLKRAVARAKAGEEAALKEAASARVAARDSDVRRAAAEGEAEVSKAEKASLEEEVARQAAEAVASQPALIRAIADRIFQSDHFSGFVANAASIMNQATVNSVLDNVAAEHPNLDKAKYGYAEVDEESILMDYARVIARKAPRLPVIEALASSPISLKPEDVLNCRADRDEKLDRLLAQVALEEVEEVEEPRQEVQEEVRDEAADLGQQQETVVEVTDEAAAQGQTEDQPHDVDAAGAVS